MINEFNQAQVRSGYVEDPEKVRLKILKICDKISREEDLTSIKNSC